MKQKKEETFDMGWSSPAKNIFLILIAAFFTVLSCDEGELLENKPPDTRVFLDEINLSGANRLNSIVRMHWSGEDPDGYVQGYDLSFDATNWSFVTTSDSVFRFDISLTSDTTDVNFFVRAVDNKGLADPDPASLVIPLKNSPPVARFDTLKVIPDSVFGVWSVVWSLDDLDGEETLDSVFLKINDGAWYPLDRLSRFATIAAVDPKDAGLQNGTFFEGQAAIRRSEPIEGLRVDGMNRMYIRVRDIAGASSEIDSTKQFFLRRQTSDLLVLDAHAVSSAENLYRSLLSRVYTGGFDYLDLQNNIPPFWEPTFGFLLEQYDKVFWFSDGTQYLNLDNQMLIERAASQLQEFLNQSGKLLVSANFVASFGAASAERTSTIFGFSPMDSISSSPGQARIPRDSLILPQSDFAADLDPLVASAFITGADPFYPKDSRNTIYEAELIPVGGWVGPSAVCGQTVFTNGETNQVFFSLELHTMNGDPAALDKFFDHVLNDLFNW